MSQFEVFEDLRACSDSRLIESAKEVALKEREWTAKVIAHLEEIARRRLFAERGYSSLFVFCVQELGYSEDQAQIRINAMRLASDVPEAREAVQTGKVSLTNLAQIQSFLRQEKKAGKSYSPEEKRDLLTQMEGLSKRECERRLATISPQSMPRESWKAISATETRLTVVLDDSLLEQLERVRALWGHRDLSYVELMREMAKFVLDQIDPMGQAVAAPPQKGRSSDQQEEGSGGTEAQRGEGLREVEGRDANRGQKVPGPAQVSEKVVRLADPESESRTRYVPTWVRQEVWVRDQGRCTYIDAETGRACGSKYALELDHVFPFAKGGEQTPENLRVVCRAHNQLYALHEYGEQKMSRWSGSVSHER